MNKLSPRARRTLGVLSRVLICAGATLAVLGTLGTWASVKLFKTIDLSLLGVFFWEGSLCLAVASLVLFGARRWPILCLAGALCILYWTFEARIDVPHRIKHQIVGSQLALFPVNRLLDQFHIDNIEVGDHATADEQILGPGIGWTMDGGLLLLLGSVLGIPGDPAVASIVGRAARGRCSACGTRWRRARAVRFCPACGTSVVPSDPSACPACRTAAAPGDRHCVACGKALRPQDSSIPGR